MAAIMPGIHAPTAIIMGFIIDVPDELYPTIIIATAEVFWFFVGMHVARRRPKNWPAVRLWAAIYSALYLFSFLLTFTFYD